VKPRIFCLFVAPSVLMMLVFIALPLLNVINESFHTTRNVLHEEVREQCTPGFPAPVCTAVRQAFPVVKPNGSVLQETIFVGFENYRSLLQPDAVVAFLAKGWSGLAGLLSIDFYHALRFTLSFTFITLPFVLGLGLVLALVLNGLTQALKGPVIFVTLLPFIITPVIGALSIRWLFVGDGILTAAIAALTGSKPAFFAQAWTIEALMIFYRIWHVTPFAFITFYAGLQSVSQDAMDAALIDGASRLERLRSVVLPHLQPLIIFVALIHMMDSYRVFDEVVGFASSAYVISLQWLTYDFLVPDNAGNRAIGRAAASSMLTLIGIVVLLVPLIRTTIKSHRRGQG
jgi:multiple sugar transport system permease protein